MKKKCICGKKIINCDPLGDCWCKDLPFKLKKEELNKKFKECVCKNCLINEYKTY